MNLEKIMKKLRMNKFFIIFCNLFLSIETNNDYSYLHSNDLKNIKEELKKVYKGNNILNEFLFPVFFNYCTFECTANSNKKFYL